MATLNGLYIFVESESLSRDVEMTSHSVESGLDITDNVRRNPYVISISGKIVGEDSPLIQSKIAGYMSSGTLVNYSGRNYMYDALITKFETSHPNTVYGGCEFSMEIKQVRFAKNSYVKDFKITPTEVKIKTIDNGGTQQVQNNNTSTYVTHTVKSGDTVNTLCGPKQTPYRSQTTFQEVVENNPGAFSTKSDNKTLQLGAKLNISLRKQPDISQNSILQGTKSGIQQVLQGVGAK